MAIVTLHNIHKSFGSEVVLDKLSMQLYPGEKVGMVGANGSGKSTILRLILGHTKPDIGQITVQKGLRIGYLPQEPDFDNKKTVMQQMLSSVADLLDLQQKIHDAAEQIEELTNKTDDEQQQTQLQQKMKQYDRLVHEFELAGGYEYESRIHATLAGLGIERHLHDLTIESLSGGQLSRLGLAQVLMLETDLLLLDEPTNHLDLQATEWLERFLVSYSGSVVIISHDRYLLDKIVTKIIELEDKKTHAWPGNYTNYVETKQTVTLQQQRQYTKRKEMVERTLDFIARNKDQEGMRKTARGRKTRLNRMLKEDPDFLKKPQQEKTINFAFAKTERKSDIIMRCENLTMSFDELTLFSGLSFDILAGDRVGITGPNGTGKSTFLKLATGHIKPSSGTIKMGPTLRIGYLDQHGEVLDGSRTVLEEAQAAAPQLSTEQLRGRLGAFLFTGEEVFKLCSQLSGGQRNRLMLAKLVLAAPDVLVMDEPTNHLDIASKEMLEEALQQYKGTVIVVSHDRYFLDRVVDKLFVIGADEFAQRQIGRTEFIGTKPVYSSYAELIRRRIAARQNDKQAEAVRAGTSKKKSAVTKTGKVRKRTPEHIRKFNKYSVERIEEMIIELEEKITHTREQFGDEKIYKNPQLLSELQQQYDADNAELDLLYEAYEYRTSK